MLDIKAAEFLPVHRILKMIMQAMQHFITYRRKRRLLHFESEVNRFHDVFERMLASYIKTNRPRAPELVRQTEHSLALVYLHWIGHCRNLMRALGDGICFMIIRNSALD